MKISAIQNQNVNNYNVNYKSKNKYANYSIKTLIASTAIFMYSLGADSFTHQNVINFKPAIHVMNTVASILGIAGTAMGIYGLTDEENNEQ